LAAGGVAERSWRDPEAPLEGLDEMRGLAVADQPRHVSNRERLVGQQVGCVAQPDRTQVGGEGRQADLVVGALELAWRGSQRASEQ
jgi:hypothetical protein